MADLPPKVLYKYQKAEIFNDYTVKNHTLQASKVTDFNDPFEALPVLVGLPQECGQLSRISLLKPRSKRSKYLQ